MVEEKAIFVSKTQYPRPPLTSVNQPYLSVTDGWRGSYFHVKKPNTQDPHLHRLTNSLVNCPTCKLQNYHCFLWQGRKNTNKQINCWSSTFSLSSQLSLDSRQNPNLLQSWSSAGPQLWLMYLTPVYGQPWQGDNDNEDTTLDSALCRVLWMMVIGHSGIEFVNNIY